MSRRWWLLMMGVVVSASSASAEDTTLIGADAPGPVPVVYFYSPTCRYCAKTAPILDDALQRWSGRIAMERYDIQTTAGLDQLLHYEQRYGGEGPPPKVYVGSTPLVGYRSIRDRLNSLIAERLERPEPTTQPKTRPGKAAPSPAPRGSYIFRKFKTFSVPTVALAGLIDGVNPCAFATIVFLISVLTGLSARRRQILIVGLTFTLAVFLTYFALGLGLLGIIKQTVVQWGLDRWLTAIVAGVAVVLGVWSFRDGVCIRRSGKLPDKALGLPRSISQRIHRIIRGGMRTGRLVIGSFSVGVVVSLLESFCTGQVYVPTIMLVLRTDSGQWAAIGYLLLYNAMFVLPLLMLMLATYWGASSDRLRRLARNNLAAAKFILAALFLTLGGLLVMTLA